MYGCMTFRRCLFLGIYSISYNVKRTGFYDMVKMEVDIRQFSCRGHTLGWAEIDAFNDPPPKHDRSMLIADYSMMYRIA